MHTYIRTVGGSGTGGTIRCLGPASAISGVAIHHSATLKATTASTTATFRERTTREPSDLSSPGRGCCS